MGVVHGAMPLNLSLEWPSVWGGKSLKFLRKMKDSRGPESEVHSGISLNESLD